MEEKENNKKSIKIIKEELNKNYKSQLERIKQKYEVEFHIEYFDGVKINKIKFNNLNHNSVSLIYDNKVKRINYIFYDCDTSSKNDISSIKKYGELNKDKKLKLIINEILKLNREYILKLKKC